MAKGDERCPDCKTAELTGGRERCQGCSLVRMIHPHFFDREEQEDGAASTELPAGVHAE